MSKTHTINGTNLLAMAQHLLILRLRETSVEALMVMGRKTIARREAEIRYTEARMMAALSGLRPTEDGIWWDVLNACNAANELVPAGWRGKNSFANSTWLDAASAALVGYWTADD